MLRGKKNPLFRKVNTRTHGVRHHFGGDYKQFRNSSHQNKTSLGSMHGKQQRELDYTPLFKFLLSKVGEDWDAVHS